MSVLALRPLMPDDAGAAHALVTAAFAGTRYLARFAEQLDAALRFDDPEYLAVLAERDARLVGLALFGTVAGARGCTRLHLLAGGDGDATDALAEGVAQVCHDARERLIVAELADEPVFAAGADALRRAGFAVEGRAGDYVADGVDLVLLVWRPRRD